MISELQKHFEQTKEQLQEQIQQEVVLKNEMKRKNMVQMEDYKKL